MSRERSNWIVRLGLPAALQAVVLTLACLAPDHQAMAQPAKAPYMDQRYRTELSTGAPPAGAPVVAGVPRGPGSLAGTWFNADASPDPTAYDPVRSA